VAVVLLVLAGRHARIVGGDDDQAAFDIGVGGGEQRVGGDVEADVLHGHQGAAAGEGDADADFQGDLLVGRPLRLAAQVVEGFQDFRGGRAGIAGAQGHAGVQGGEGDGLVAVEECVMRSGQVVGSHPVSRTTPNAVAGPLPPTSAPGHVVSQVLQ
jgi:hypothetical protein